MSSIYRLGDIQTAHLAEVSNLQQSLQTESDKRQEVERNLVQLREEVAIGIDDLQPASGHSDESEQPKSFGMCVSLFMRVCCVCVYIKYTYTCMHALVYVHVCVCVCEREKKSV